MNSTVLNWFSKQRIRKEFVNILTRKKHLVRRKIDIPIQAYLSKCCIKMCRNMLATWCFIFNWNFIIIRALINWIRQWWKVKLRCVRFYGICLVGEQAKTCYQKYQWIVLIVKKAVKKHYKSETFSIVLFWTFH